MTLDQAIKHLGPLKLVLDDPLTANVAAAIELGIEALERVDLWQSVTSDPDKHYLPSQTKD